MAMTSGSVLLIDDSPVFRLAVKNILSARGYQLVPVSSGEEALAEIKRRMPEVFGLIILDLHLTGIDGLETLKRLKNIPGYAEVPVIIATVDSSLAMIRRAIELGATDFIQKPLTEELIARIEKFLSPSGWDEAELAERFSEILKLELARAARGQTPLTLLLARRDRPLGAQTPKVVEFLRHNLRGIDTVCLLSTSTLGLVLPLTDNRGGQIVAGKLQDWLAKFGPGKWQLATATYPDDGNDREELLGLVRSRLAGEAET